MPDWTASAAYLAEHSAEMSAPAALAAAAEACERQPDEAMLWLHLGLLLLGDDAASGYSAIRTGMPDPYERAESLITETQFDQALAWACLARGKDSGRGALILARVRLWRAEPDQAAEALAAAAAGINHEQLAEVLSVYTELLQAQPGEAWRYAEYGTALARARQIDDALTAHEKSISLDPGNASFHFNLGNFLLSIGQFDDVIPGRLTRALAAFQVALELVDGQADPQSYGSILHRIAEVHREMGNQEEAIRQYREAVEHQRQRNIPARDQAVTLLAIARLQQDAGRYIEAFDAGIEAIQILKASAKADPHFLAEALVFTAGIQIESDPEQALPLLEEGRQLLGLPEVSLPLEQVTVLDLIAQAYSSLGRKDEAKEAAATADDILDTTGATFNISWPWNGDEGAAINITYEIRDERIYIILTAEGNGLRFNKRLVRFTRGFRYLNPDLTHRSEPVSRRRDRRPLVVSLPYQAEWIEKISYVITDNLFTLIVKPTSPDTKFHLRDVEFSRVSVEDVIATEP